MLILKIFKIILIILLFVILVIFSGITIFGSNWIADKYRISENYSFDGKVYVRYKESFEFVSIGTLVKLE